MSKPTQLSWGDRFALIEAYGPTEAAVCQAFGVTADELTMANNLKASGTLAVATSFDTKKYGNPFVMTADADVDPTDVKGATKHVVIRAKPATATKAVKVPQKRGRKGDKIQNALKAIPLTPVPVDEFRQQHGVSVAVLRQSKRFVEKMDPVAVAELGVVKVRQDKATKVLMIWREVNK